MICGLNRAVATELSFLVGIPTLLAAGAYKIFKSFNGSSHESWWLLLLGASVAAVVSFIAVKWLLRFVQSHTFVSFGIYRIILGVFLLWTMRPR
jgi:undecaprenyl-diphosphatase